MGIVILPFLLIAIAVFIIGLVLLWRAYRKNQLNSKVFILGAAISALIYCIIYYDYSNDYSAWPLGPYLLFPFAMIMIPFVTGLILKLVNRPMTISIANSLFVCVVLSGIFIPVFYQFTFEIVAYFGLEKQY